MEEYEYINMSELIYVVAISLQLAGAVLLINKYWEKKLQKQVDALWLKQNHMTGKTIHIGDAAPTNVEYALEVILSRIAFVYLALGYLLGVCGERGMILRDMGFVVIVSFILVMVGKNEAKKNSKKFDAN